MAGLVETVLPSVLAAPPVALRNAVGNLGVPMVIIDSQVHACEANTPKRPWHTVPHWPDHVTGDDMVAAMDKVGVHGAIFISAFSLYRYDASYAVAVQQAHPRSIRDRQARQSRRSCGGRCHRRLEGHARRGRHPHHHDEGGKTRAE
jgi:hypothetical protein